MPFHLSKKSFDDSDTFFLFIHLFIYLLKQITLWEQNSETTKARNLKFGQIIGLCMDLGHAILETLRHVVWSRCTLNL